MRYFAIAVILVFLGCVPQVKDGETTIGFYDYRKNVQAVVDARAKACEGVEGCVPVKITDKDVLGIIGLVKKELESQGARVVGIEASSGRVWYAK